MGKKTPKAPEPPKASDSMVDQYTPYGNSVYKPIDGTSRYSNTVTLDPMQQGILDSQNKITSSLLQSGEGLTKRINDTYAKPFDFSNMTTLRKSLDFNALPQGISYVPPTAAANGGTIQKQLGDAGNIQNSLDFSQYGALPTTSDFTAERQRVEDAVYGRNTARLDPQYQQEETSLMTRLTNQGVPEGSAAWNQAMNEFARRKEAAYAGARNDAIATGGAEQSRLFGLNLGARQQGVGETTTAGNFANSAQNQRYSQILGRGNFGNAAQQQDFTQQLQNNDQQFGQGMSNANLNNSLRAQMAQEQALDAQMREAGRNKEIEMRTLNRDSPVMDLARLLQLGGGVTNPQFNNNIDLGALNSANYAGRLNAYNQQMNSNNSSKGALFGLLGNIGAAYAGSQAGSAALSALMASDIRLKDNIEHVGQRNGINIYEFTYKGDSKRYRGVMAQEVKHIPGAVVLDTDGFFEVDYSKIPVAFEEVAHG